MLPNSLNLSFYAIFLLLQLLVNFVPDGSFILSTLTPNNLRLADSHEKDLEVGAIKPRIFQSSVLGQAELDKNILIKLRGAA